MDKRQQKLELTWVGKDERPKLEPRILIEDPDLSYHADKRYGDDDIFDNILTQGDNLLALKALENAYRGKVKCIYIDPPYNPDFIIETADEMIIAEVKNHNEMEDTIVIAKASAANQWIGFVNKIAIENGKKEWRYLLIPDNTLFPSTTLDGLISVHTWKANWSLENNPATPPPTHHADTGFSA